MTGAAIGGEYAAINSAIDELIPARVRGWADLAINGTFWLGAALGSVASIILLDPRWFRPDLGWRLGFGVGATVGIVIIFLRERVPESPRWLLTHGGHEEAKRVVDAIERQIEDEPGATLSAVTKTMKIQPRPGFGFIGARGRDAENLPAADDTRYRLILSQAFLYNGVFFTFPLVLRIFTASAS